MLNQILRLIENKKAIGIADGFLLVGCY